MGGYGYRTFYGIFKQDGKRIAACGEPLHDRCPPPNARPRETPHDVEEFGSLRSRRARDKCIAPGIDLLISGRYGARANKKRLGTYATIEEAQAALDKYKRSHPNGKTKNRDKRTQRK
jgi:hypothetical protein